MSESNILRAADIVKLKAHACPVGESKLQRLRTGVFIIYVLIFLISGVDIHAGNLVYKAIVHMLDVKNGNILTGTKAPVILTSRSDTCEVKVNSIALAALAAETLKRE